MISNLELIIFYNNEPIGCPFKYIYIYIINFMNFFNERNKNQKSKLSYFLHLMKINRKTKLNEVKKLDD